LYIKGEKGRLCFEISGYVQDKNRPFPKRGEDRRVWGKNDSRLISEKSSPTSFLKKKGFEGMCPSMSKFSFLLSQKERRSVEMSKMSKMSLYFIPGRKCGKLGLSNVVCKWK